VPIGIAGSVLTTLCVAQAQYVTSCFCSHLHQVPNSVCYRLWRDTCSGEYCWNACRLPVRGKSSPTPPVYHDSLTHHLSSSLGQPPPMLSRLDSSLKRARVKRCTAASWTRCGQYDAKKALRLSSKAVPHVYCDRRRSLVSRSLPMRPSKLPFRSVSHRCLPRRRS
jgi:hypothetical protein